MSRTLAVAACLPLWIGALATGAAPQNSRRPLPLEVRSSTPLEDQADVRLDAIVQIQFSRPADPRSFEKRILIRYSKEESAERGEAQPPSIAFETRYQTGTNILELRPTRPFERFRHVTVELLEGIRGADGSVLAKWSLQFRTGG